MLHYIETSSPILAAEDGMILGNGDLSVSVYQRSEHIVWRFGKNDVWDRRLATDQDAEPAHINEIKRGILEEGWVSHDYRDGAGEANENVRDPGRMKEICGVCPSYTKFPYPCPKPVGELWMHLPIDKHGMKVSQKLCIETSELEITITWTDGGIIKLMCCIHPVHNALAVHWKVEDWNSMTALGHQVPVWFAVHRPADTTIEAFRHDLFSHARNPHIPYPDEPGACPPLPPPETRNFEGRPVIEQRFYPDLEFTDGFRYFMQPFTTGLNLDPANITLSPNATIHLWGNDDVLEGWMCCAIPCSTDEGGHEARAKRFIRDLDGDLGATLRQWHLETIAASLAFWDKSSIEMDDKVLEHTWYESLYIRRCTYRHDVIAPGLGLPSTVQDYSMWHGDYHMNFNYQQPFYGDYGSNHPEIGDAYFPGMAYSIEIGKAIAEKYWDSPEGIYIPLSTYPFRMDKDPFGTGPMCRLAYCTGWATNHYWSRFLHTWDIDWLRGVGYEVLRGGAQFYVDFLELRDDGRYHAFPSVQGESFFTGRPEDYTDQPQVIRNIRYCMESAIRASEILGVDEGPRNIWRETVDKLVPTDEVVDDDLSEAERRRYALNAPPFVCMDHEQSRPKKGDSPHELRMTMDSHMWRASCNTLPWFWMIRLRNDIFDAETELDLVRAHIQRWRLPGGHLRSMTASDHGYIAGYGESLGIIAPIQEMMMQSWDGSIRVFPAWKKDMNGKFSTLRAEGAFLVSCKFENGVIHPVGIFSEKGNACRVANVWKTPVRVIDEMGKEVRHVMDGEYIEFGTEVGHRYEVTPEQYDYDTKI